MSRPESRKTLAATALDPSLRRDSDLRDGLSPSRFPPHRLSTPSLMLNPSRGRVADTRCDPGSVGCERRRAPVDRSSRADESGVGPRRAGMVRREVRETGRGTSRRGPSGRSDGHPACRPLRSRRFSLDTGMRLASNASSGEPGEPPSEPIRDARKVVPSVVRQAVEFYADDRPDRLSGPRVATPPPDQAIRTEEPP
jgi:hypothetical protein